MKLTAFPHLGAEFCSFPSGASLLWSSFSWVKYCSANSSRSLGWFRNTSTVKLCNSSVSPSGISILIPVFSLWVWIKAVCLRARSDQSLRARLEPPSRAPTGGGSCQAKRPHPLFFPEWKMAVGFRSEHLLLLLATGNPRMWPGYPWQPPIQGLRVSGGGAVGRKIQIAGKRENVWGRCVRWMLKGRDATLHDDKINTQMAATDWNTWNGWRDVHSHATFF